MFLLNLDIQLLFIVSSKTGVGSLMWDLTLLSQVMWKVFFKNQKSYTCIFISDNDLTNKELFFPSSPCSLHSPDGKFFCQLSLSLSARQMQTLQRKHFKGNSNFIQILLTIKTQPVCEDWWVCYSVLSPDHLCVHENFISINAVIHQECNQSCSPGKHWHV